MTRKADILMRMNSVRNYVTENLNKAHTVEQLAGIAHLSKFHFHRLHHAMTGETVQGMVNRLRLESAAATLLYHRRRSVTRVAVDHGYSSSANFTKAFSRHFGCSPSSYRVNSKIGKAVAFGKREHGGIEPDVRVTRQPERRLAYLRRRGAYDHMDILEMHRRVQQWARENGCATREPVSVGITWSDSLITEEENWIYDACVAVSEGTRGDGEVGALTLRGGPVAELVFVLADGDSHDFTPWWDWLVRDWFLDSRYELGPSPGYEFYVETVHGLEVRLCLPLQQNAWRE